MTTRPFHLLEQGKGGPPSPHIPGQGKAPQNRSLERGLDILRAFRPGSEHLSNGDLSEITGLSKSTVSRLTQTLVRSGFLDYDTVEGGYRLAPSILGMAHSMYHGSFLLQVATPLMTQIAREHQVNVGLAAADGDEMIYLESVRFSRRKSAQRADRPAAAHGCHILGQSLLVDPGGEPTTAADRAVQIKALRGQGWPVGDGHRSSGR
ncbi:IclR family transcriptional regulator [Pseudomonas sp. EZ-C24]|uniref:IclR family transcriptional regulator n=1 Tax=Pseudomonas sp. EZ-C24 TaxID=2753617 RepID=UPI0021D28C9B|nr:helix-turn-helix domain-containing protein [Pseudomonas sp. EZ-C24]